MSESCLVGFNRWSKVSLMTFGKVMEELRVSQRSTEECPRCFSVFNLLEAVCSSATPLWTRATPKRNHCHAQPVACKETSGAGAEGRREGEQGVRTQVWEGWWMLNPASLLNKVSNFLLEVLYHQRKSCDKMQKMCEFECNRLGAHLCDSGQLIQLPFIC